MAAPFRFGIGPGDLGVRGGPDVWREIARRTEDLGYSSLNVGDHPSGAMGSGAGPFTLLMAAADATDTLRVGALMLAADFRPPVVVAQEALGVHYLSGGRLELGIGAGWSVHDYVGAGIPFEPAGVRIERLAEAVAVLRPLLAGQPCDFEGQHLTAHAPANPLAAEIGTPPPLVMGGGGRRMLELAGRMADIVTVNVSLDQGLGGTAFASATARATDEKIETIRRTTAGRVEPPELQLYVHVAAIVDDRDAAVAHLSDRLSLPFDEVLASPHVLVGSVDEVVDRLIERRERWGFSYVTWGASSTDQMAPVVSRLTST